jgi:hypothetical protein
MRRPRTRGHWVGLGFLVAVPIAIAGVLIGVQLHADALGCGSIDPTDPANYSTVTIVNDTPSPVVVGHCVGSYCRVDQLPARLAAGQRFTGNAACGVSGSDMTSWQLTGGDGRTLGFVAVDTPRKHDGLVFDVSRASRDRRTSTSSG